MGLLENEMGNKTIRWADYFGFLPAEGVIIFEGDSLVNPVKNSRGYDALPEEIYLEKLQEWLDNHSHWGITPSGIDAWRKYVESVKSDYRLVHCSSHEKSSRGGTRSRNLVGRRKKRHSANRIHDLLRKQELPIFDEHPKLNFICSSIGGGLCSSERETLNNSLWLINEGKVAVYTKSPQMARVLKRSSSLGGSFRGLYVSDASRRITLPAWEYNF
jgi:hypothetical protein